MAGSLTDDPAHDRLWCPERWTRGPGRIAVSKPSQAATFGHRSSQGPCSFLEPGLVGLSFLKEPLGLAVMIGAIHGSPVVVPVLRAARDTWTYLDQRTPANGGSPAQHARAAAARRWPGRNRNGPPLRRQACCASPAATALRAGLDAGASAPPGPGKSGQAQACPCRPDPASVGRTHPIPPEPPAPGGQADHAQKHPMETDIK